MRTFGKIETGFWQNTKIRALSERDRLFLLYLLTSPHGNSVGCYVLPVGYVQSDLGWTSATISEALGELSSAKMIDHDPETMLTRIVGWWGHNSIENRNVAIAAVKTMAILPKSSPVYRRLLLALRERQRELKEEVWAVFSKSVEDGLGNGIETVSQGYANGFDTPSDIVLNGIETKEPNLTKPSLRAAPSDEGHPPAAAIAESAKDKLFSLGVPYLVKRAGKSDDQARRVIGGWLKGNSDETVLAAIGRAQTTEAIEPIGYINAVLKPKKPATDDGRPAPYRVGSL